MIDSKQRKTQISLPSDTELLITRTFDAPRDLVWEMWTKSEHLKNWWGPQGWTMPVSEMDFRVGGSWFYCMEGPDGMLSCGRAEYLFIEAPQKIEYRDSFVDNDGNLLAQFPVSKNTVQFTENEGRTTVHSSTAYGSRADRDQVIEMGVEEGVTQTFARLDEYLSKTGG